MQHRPGSPTFRGQTIISGAQPPNGGEPRPGSGPGRSSFDIERETLLPKSPATLPKEKPYETIAPEKVDYLMTALLFLPPAMGGLAFGYDIGATSGALLSMTSPELSGTDWFSLTTLQSGMVVSLSLAGALVGSVAALVWGDKLGRRKELLLASAFYAAGSAAVFAAPSLSVVLIGRALYGAGIGFAMHGAPAYIAETCPPSVRGLLISLKEAFIVGGILGGYLMSYLNVDTVGGWRWDYGAGLILAGILAAGMSFLPESPRWLLLSGAGAPAATQALRRAKGAGTSNAAIEAEIEDIQATIAASPRAIPASSSLSQGGKTAIETSVLEALNLSEVLRPRYRRPLTVGVSLMLFQQITGQPSVLYYAASIFKQAGFDSANAATAISVVLGFFKLIMTGVAVATVDSWGRRPLLLTGIAAIVASLVALGGIQTGVVPIPDGAAAWASLLALLTYVGAYQLSFGPISWLIVGEVFPLRVRGQAVALATLTNFGSNFAVSLVLPSLQEAFGSGIYFVFAVIGVGAFVVVRSSVPETKGKSLEDIERLWEHEARQ